MTNGKDGKEGIGALEPKLLWQHFSELAAIPRGSRNEEGAARYVLSVASRLGLEARRDAAGNTVIRKAAAKGREGSPTTILQGHLDMVCEKNSEIVHDFEKDPIRPVRIGDWVRASGTTLGADNGIGVAAALAVLESADVCHGPLECLFTIDEETGLTGAFNLDPAVLTGKRMLNLDTEEEGAVYIGCAGGLDTLLKTTIAFVSPSAGSAGYRLSVKGLRGGHSGVDIHEGRGNALKILSRALAKALDRGAEIASLEGGSKRNAIPREASARLALPAAAAADLGKDLARLQADGRAELGQVDPGLHLVLEPLGAVPERVFPPEDAERVVAFLHAAPHGVLAMSPDIPGLVQTSTNLAVVSMEGDVLSIATSQRSSVHSAKVDAGEMLVDAATLAGFETEQGDGYPGWAPNVKSPLLARAKEVHARLFGKEPSVKAIHAGLECGIISEKIPGLDVISFGPTIRNAHSPDEEVSVLSVAGFWRYLTAMLAA